MPLILLEQASNEEYDPGHGLLSFEKSYGVVPAEFVICVGKSDETVGSSPRLRL